MWQLIARDENGVEVGRYELDEEAGSVIVGRGAESHILLDDKSISREHAFFYVSEGEMVVEDAGSSLGIMVDGYALEEPLFVGAASQIQIGPFWIEVRPPGASEALVSVDAEFAADAQVAGMPAVVDAPFDPTVKPQTGLLKLVAISGLNAGSEVPITFPGEFDVGRDEELEVSVMDPTVSRRHARLKLTEKGLLIIDLRSSNGTFINGEKVKRLEAGKGSRIRFGEVAYELQAASAAEIAAQTKKKLKLTPRHMILIGGGGIFVLGLVLLGLLLPKGAPPKRHAERVRTTTADSKMQRKFRQQLSAARKLMAERKWDKAQEALLATKEIFARHDTRDDLLAEINEEQHHAKLLKKAKALFSGEANFENYSSAKLQFELIKTTSTYFGDAQLPLEKIRAWLSEYYRVEGMSYSKSRLQKNRNKAQQFLCKYFELIPEYQRSGGDEEKHREILVRLEKRLKKYKHFKKCEAKRFVQPSVGTSKIEVDALAEIKRQHQLAPLVRIIALYYEGKLDAAIDQLRKLQNKKSMNKHRHLLAAVFNKLTYIKGKFSEGNGFVQSGLIPQAQRAFDEALAKDSALIPPTLVSHVKREIGRLLADNYLRLGQVEYSRSRYEDAYQLWHKGKMANLNHVGIRSALLKLHAIARNWISEAESLKAAQKSPQARAKFESIRKITEPGSPYYTKATQALADLK